jgi:hypothetical protein
MIRRKPMETGVLIDDSGKTFIKRIGRPGSVNFSHGELLRARGMTFTHNHPGGVGPSLEDVQLGVEYGLKEVRVVTGQYRHGVSMLAPRLLGPLTAGFAGEEAGAILAVGDYIRRGLVHPRDFDAEVRHRTWQRLSSNLGFDYWRQES